MNKQELTDGINKSNELFKLTAVPEHEQKLVDNTAAIRMTLGAIAKIIQPRYISKKKLKECTDLISTCNEELSRIKFTADKYQNEKVSKEQFVMEVRNVGEKRTWTEDLENHKVPEEMEASYSKELAREIIERFNETLRPDEKPREVVRVFKKISITADKVIDL